MHHSINRNSEDFRHLSLSPYLPSSISIFKEKEWLNLSHSTNILGRFIPQFYYDNYNYNNSLIILLPSCRQSLQFQTLYLGHSSPDNHGFGIFSIDVISIR